MRHLFALAFALLLADLDALHQVSSQTLPLRGAGKGAPGGASYTGPGDIVSGAFAFWALYKCYNSAYAGNVADVYAPLDASHTLITCSSGGTINETLQALSTTCATSCTIKTLYDQSSGNNCAAAPCNLVQATIASRPTVTLSCLGALPCMTTAGSVPILQTAATATLAQPFSAIACLKQTTFTGYGMAIGAADGSSGIFMGGPGANLVDMFLAADNTWAATDNAWHVIQAIGNGASSSGTTDGSTTALAGAGSQNILTSGNISILNDGGSEIMVGSSFLFGLWGSSINANLAAMNTNIRAYCQ